ncbi:MAG: 8-oxo-dGTP diphosphatase MutT [Gammaproteobacteria bacterium]|nr:8-oxo-dGTP diphosphatase MutT [Gammaproteobacteria bacterium]
MSRQADLVRLQVVAGILCDADNRVLITERVDDGPFHGMWEFPGGKRAPGEMPEAALTRELQEEIGVTPRSYQFFMSLKHDYPDRLVAIDFYLVTTWNNEPLGLEGQELRWVEAHKLAGENLLPADQPIVSALSMQAAGGVLFVGSKAQRSEP